MQFGCSTFYRKLNRPWVAPPATHDSDMKIEDDSDLDDSYIDTDYVLEEEEIDITPTTSGENNINIYLDLFFNYIIYIILVH